MKASDPDRPLKKGSEASADQRQHHPEDENFKDVERLHFPSQVFESSWKRKEEEEENHHRRCQKKRQPSQSKE